MENLGSLLNGVVNYNSWLPEKSMYYDGQRSSSNYSKRAVEAKVDPLGYYLAPFGYASGQLIEQASRRWGRSTKSPRKYLHETNTRPSSVRSRFGGRERKETAVLQAQFVGIVDRTSSSSAARASR